MIAKSPRVSAFAGVGGAGNIGGCPGAGVGGGGASITGRTQRGAGCAIAATTPLAAAEPHMAAAGGPPLSAVIAAQGFT